MSIEKIIMEGIKDLCEGSEKGIEKSIPMKNEWTTKLKAAEKLMKEANIAKQKAKRAKQAFWAMVEEDTGMYDRNFRISDSRKELEIYAED